MFARYVSVPVALRAARFAMWLTALLVYCVVCWLIGFGVICTRWWADATRGATSAARLTLVSSGMVVLAPLILPALLVIVSKCLYSAYQDQCMLERELRTYRPYEFATVHDVDDSVAEEFELHTPPLLELDYDLIGDFRLKAVPYEVHDRFLLSPDGTTLAAICALLDTGSVCLISVLEDGTCVDTSDAEGSNQERAIEPVDKLSVSYLPGASMQELVAQHVKTVQELCERNGTRPIRFSREQFREIVIYDQRIHCRWRYRHGDMDAPPAPDFASLRATSDAPAHTPRIASVRT
jgi:hypothetical protein